MNKPAKQGRTAIAFSAAQVRRVLPVAEKRYLQAIYDGRQEIPTEVYAMLGQLCHAIAVELGVTLQDDKGGTVAPPPGDLVTWASIMNALSELTAYVYDASWLWPNALIHAALLPENLRDISAHDRSALGADIARNLKQSVGTITSVIRPVIGTDDVVQ